MLSSLLIASAACGSDAEVLGPGASENRCGFADPGCLGCATLGACCLSSMNCPVATICNLPEESLFDQTAQMGICLDVTCQSDAECDPPKVCGLDRICRAPTCQVDADCAPDICVAGACQVAPTAAQVARCEVVSGNATLEEGRALPLVAVAHEASGAPLPGVRFTWRSSDEAVVSVMGSVAIAGAMQGVATLTATVDGGAATPCSGSLQVQSLPTLAGANVRVVVIDGEGSPLQGASVSVSASGTRTATTNASGLATFSGLSSTVRAVTVVAPGFQYLTVLEPGTNDLLVPLPRLKDDTRAGGIRGILDISSTVRSDLQIGFAGPAIPSNLLDFGLEALLGDLIPSQIRLPELGLDLGSEAAFELPGGFVVGLGSRRFTADGSGPRCQGAMVGASQLGCFLTRTPQGRTAGWALAGQLSLEEVAPVVRTLSEALEGSEDPPVRDIFGAVLPFVRTLHHALAASVEVSYAPTVAGGADFRQYRRTDLTASQPLSILSVVDVPNLPGPEEDCADAAVLVAGVRLRGRGLVPLGFSAGLDTLRSNEAANCRINGVAEAFGSGSATTQEGQMALSMAPPHSGAEGGDLFMVLVAADLEALFSSEALELTAIVQRAPTGIAETFRIPGPYLARPSGSIDGSARTISVREAIAGATLNRYELQGRGRTWLIYAPSDLTTLHLPPVPAPSVVLSSLTKAYMLSMSTTGTFSEVFDLGSEKGLTRLFDTMTRLSIQQCGRSSTARCRF